MSKRHPTPRPAHLLLLALLALLALLRPALATARPQTIKVVMDNNYPPYVFQDDKGKLQGILVDQWRLWEKKTGITAELYAMDWAKALARMEAGEFDVIDTIFKTEKRSAWLDFTPAYAQLEVPIFFDREIAGITDADSLKGFVVAAKKGDAAIDLLQKHGIDQLLLFDSYEAVIQAARARKVNVFVIDKPPALYYLYKYELHEQFKHSAPLNIGAFHRAVPKGKHELRQLVEEGFSQISARELKKIETTWSGSSLGGHLAWEYILGAAAILAFLALALLAWNRMLQRLVLLRTAELKASEERFSAIYNAVNDAIFIHDLETGAIVDVNRRMSEMYGYSREEARSLPVELFSAGLPPYSQTEAMAWIAKARQGNAQIFEWRAKKRSGELFWVEVNMRRAQIGAIDRLLVTVRDIGERKSSEEVLRKSQAMLRHIVDSIPQFVFWKDRESVYLGCNRSFAEAAGLAQPEEIVGKSDFDLPWLPEESEAYRADDRDVMSNNKGKLHIIEQQLQASGQRLWVDTSKVPLLDAQGQVYGVLGLYDDITARKQVEEELLQEKAFSDAVINSLPGVFYVYEEGQRLVKWNNVLAQLSGLPAEALRHRHPLDLVSEKDRKQVETALAKVMSTGKVELVEAEVLLQGKSIPYLLTGSLLVRGGKRHLIGIGLDITERKKLEAGLRQAQKMESIGTLAGGIAHDFNNILTAIIGYTDLAMTREENEEHALRDDLQQLRLAAYRAANLVRQILAFSRKQQEEKTPLQLSLIVKEALKLLRASIPSTIEIRQEISSSASVLADPTEIHQLIMNLCTNAYHAMEGLGGVLSVTLTEVESTEKIIDNGSELEPGHYLLLTVSDTGCGMDRETLPKIFDPYFTTKETGKGTGLGLAMVHGIVKGHRGELAVSSEPGRGTTFHVYLPTIQAAAAPTTAEQEAPRARAHERVMVVDDEAVIRNLLSYFLLQAGYRVEAFANGREAWQVMAARPHDWELLITDQTMPEMTGEQLASKVKELRPNLPIILCSGYNSLLTETRIKASEEFVFLQKPVGRNALLQLVATTLADQEGTRQ